MSTPKQLAVALSTKCVMNTTVLLVKPKHDCPFIAVKLPPIKGISAYLAAHYDHHSATPLGRERHKCNGTGPPMQCSGVSMAVHYANEVLSTRDFTVDGQARAMITSITNPGTSTYASFEVNFIAGWAHCQMNQHPEFSTRVQDFIAQCWCTGEESIVEGSAVKSRLKVSAEAVQAKLASQYTDGLLLLSEVPVVSQIRAVYQKIGQHKHPEHESRKRSRIIRNGSLRTKRSKVTLQWI